MNTSLRIFAKVAAPVLLAASAVTGMAGAAHAVTPAYSSDLTTLQNQCLANGEEHSPVSGYGGVYIPTTTVQYGSTGVCVALVQTLLNDDGAYYSCNNSQDLSVDGQDGPITWSHIWFVN